MTFAIGILIYIIMWAITAVILSRLGYEESILMGLFWYVFLPMGVVEWFVRRFG